MHVVEMVGWEGVWGMLLSAFFMFIFYTIPGKDFGSYENPFQATMQIFNNRTLLMAMLCSSLVIGPFNYYGAKITQHFSAMHRCLICASRMCVVWIFCIASGWESIRLMQVIGYTLIVFGNLIYNQVINYF